MITRMMRPLHDLSRGDNAKLMRKFIDTIAPTHFVTLSTNWDSLLFRNHRSPRSLSPDRKLANIAAALHRWGAYVDSDLLGGSWLRKPNLRMRGFAVPEHLETNIHYHCFISVAAQISPTEFEASAVKCWKKAVPTGDAEVKLFEELKPEWYVSKEGRKIDFGNLGLIGPQ
jgi:hypothetical protein